LIPQNSYKDLEIDGFSVFGNHVNWPIEHCRQRFLAHYRFKTDNCLFYRQVRVSLIRLDRCVLAISKTIKFSVRWAQKVFGRSHNDRAPFFSARRYSRNTTENASAESESPNDKPIDLALIKTDHSEISYHISTSMRANGCGEFTSLFIVMKSRPHESNVDRALSMSPRPRRRSLWWGIRDTRAIVLVRVISRTYAPHPPIARRSSSDAASGRNLYSLFTSPPAWRLHIPRTIRPAARSEPPAGDPYSVYS